MAFDVKIPDGLKNIGRKYEEKFNGKVRQALEKQLEEELTQIRLRTQQGTDSEGRTFASYSPGYVKYRLDKGRGSSPDLTFSGKMLRNLRSKLVSKKGYLEGVLFFIDGAYPKRSKGQKKVPKVHDVVRWNNKSRHFFGLSKEQVTRIKQKIREALR